MASAIVIILIILFGTFYGITSEIFQISKNNLDKILVGHLMLEISGPNLHECARNCMSFALCKSFDYDLRKRLCKLNDVEMSAVNPSEIITKKGSLFSDIKEWPSAMVQKCSSRPCPNNQRCLINGGSFVCRDVITCAIDQHIEHGNVEVFAPTENNFLDKALLKCDVGYIPIQQEVECQASGKWQPAICQKVSDCKEILDTFPQAKSGLYEIELWNSKTILTVNCDMETEGGGWTLFHRRINGSVGFYRNFTEYENGFGNADGELWLGLKSIQELADQGTTDLRLDMTTDNNDTGQETFGEFMLTDGTNYKLNIGSRYTGDGVLARGLFNNNGMAFSTFDRDLDIGSRDCAVERHGAWWYTQCSLVNLNGLYVTPGTFCSVPGARDRLCGHVHEGYSGLLALKNSSMMLRRK